MHLSQPRLFVSLALLTFALGAGAEEIDHAQMIRAWDDQSFARGRQLYDVMCITCHGTPEKEGTLPTSRKFWLEPFKNGNDPFSMYKTLAKGFGQMPAWTFLTPEQRYDAIHYVREAFIRPQNPAAYFKVDERYLASLPKETVSESGGTGEKVPQYLRMDFGPALFWTLQVESNNIAYKAIAVRLDEGPGGVSKGHAWMLYDHDTMRVAAGWTGDQVYRLARNCVRRHAPDACEHRGRKGFRESGRAGLGEPADGKFCRSALSRPGR